MPEGEARWPEKHGDWPKRENGATPISVFQTDLAACQEINFLQKREQDRKYRNAFAMIKKNTGL